jgi:hypothetical protein
MSENAVDDDDDEAKIEYEDPAETARRRASSGNWRSLGKKHSIDEPDEKGIES